MLSRKDYYVMLDMKTEGILSNNLPKDVIFCVMLCNKTETKFFIVMSWVKTLHFHFMPKGENYCVMLGMSTPRKFFDIMPKTDNFFVMLVMKT